jgi:GDP-4-dehydro-6-deoxy-D-mannose reductase
VRQATVLVTGASGFVGRRLCAYLERRPGVRVVAVDLRQPAGGCGATFVQVDMGAPRAAARLLRAQAPTHVVHLAGGRGGGLAAMLRANLRPVVGLLAAVREAAPEAVVILAGSAAEYGNVPRRALPVRETRRCAPLSPYGVAKLLATHVALHHWRRDRLRVMVARPFQLIGAGIGTDLAPGAFAAQIRAGLATGERVVRVGNLAPARDYVDVDDAARALWSLCRHPRPGEIFNVCSGVAVTMRAVLDAMLATAGGPWRVEVEASRLRGGWDPGASRGSAAKIQAHCGWRARTPLAASVAALLAAPVETLA